MQVRVWEAGHAAGVMTEATGNACTETPSATVLPQGVVQVAGTAHEFELILHAPFEQEYEQAPT